MRTPASYTERDERRRKQLAAAHADMPKTQAARFIEQAGKAMLDMTAPQIEEMFGWYVRLAFERGYLRGNPAAVYPRGGLRYRACTSGITQRSRERRMQERAGAITRRRAALKPKAQW